MSIRTHVTLRTYAQYAHLYTRRVFRLDDVLYYNYSVHNYLHCVRRHYHLIPIISPTTAHGIVPSSRITRFTLSLYHAMSTFIPHPPPPLLALFLFLCRFTSQVSRPRWPMGRTEEEDQKPRSDRDRAISRSRSRGEPRASRLGDWRHWPTRLLRAGQLRDSSESRDSGAWRFDFSPIRYSPRFLLSLLARAIYGSVCRFLSQANFAANRYLLCDSIGPRLWRFFLVPAWRAKSGRSKKMPRTVG